MNQETLHAERLTLVPLRDDGTAGAIPGSEHGDVDYVITRDEWAAGRG